MYSEPHYAEIQLPLHLETGARVTAVLHTYSRYAHQHSDFTTNSSTSQEEYGVRIEHRALAPKSTLSSPEAAGRTSRRAADHR